MLLFAISVLPVIGLLLLIYKLDKNKEPFNLLIKIFLLGALTIIPAVILELIVSVFLPSEDVDSFQLFLSVFIGVALIEEFVKWFIVKQLTYSNQEFDETYDALVYSAYSSLGFACLENILYVFQNGFGTGVLRALTAVPGHCCFGIIMGYCLANAKLNHVNGNKRYIRYLIYSMLFPVIAHTFYDYFLFLGDLPLWIISYIIILVVSIILVVKSAKRNYYFNNNRETTYIEVPQTSGIYEYKAQGYNYNQNMIRPRFCYHCGSELIPNAQYCAGCGCKIE